MQRFVEKSTPTLTIRQQQQQQLRRRRGQGDILRRCGKRELCLILGHIDLLVLFYPGSGGRRRRWREKKSWFISYVYIYVCMYIHTSMPIYIYGCVCVYGKQIDLASFASFYVFTCHQDASQRWIDSCLYDTIFPLSAGSFFSLFPSPSSASFAFLLDIVQAVMVVGVGRREPKNIYALEQRRRQCVP